MRGILAVLFLCVILNMADGHHFSAIHTSHDHSLSHGVLGVNLLSVATFILLGISSAFSGSVAHKHSTGSNTSNKLHWAHRSHFFGPGTEDYLDGNGSRKKGYGSQMSSRKSNPHKKGHRSNHGLHGRNAHPKVSGPIEDPDNSLNSISTTAHGSDFDFRMFNPSNRGCNRNPYSRGGYPMRRGFGQGALSGGLDSIRGSAYDVMYETNGAPKRDTGYGVTYERNGYPKRGYGYGTSYMGTPTYPKRGSGLKMGSEIDVYSNRGPGGRLSSGAESYSKAGPGGSAISSASASSKVGPGGHMSSTADAYSKADRSG